MQYIKSNWISAASGATVTDPEHVQGAARYGLQWSTTGAPSSFNLILEGSLDGSSWVTLVQVGTSQTEALIRWSDDGFNPTSNVETHNRGPVAYIRLNLVSVSGGTAPTITASAIVTD